MSDVFLGEIRIVGFNFAPRGWATCDGQLLSISQNTALFSLLGTQFGGNGTSNFGLPNFEGNIPVDYGSGPGLTPRSMGEVGGSDNVTLLTTEMASHIHTYNADSDIGTTTSPASALSAVPQVPPRTPNGMYNTSAANSQMLAGGVLPAGGGQPHNNMQPFLVMMFIIAMQGIFPARN